jgi:hypothetical protein
MKELEEMKGFLSGRALDEAEETCVRRQEEDSMNRKMYKTGGRGREYQAMGGYIPTSI